MLKKIDTQNDASLESVDRRSFGVAWAAALWSQTIWGQDGSPPNPPARKGKATVLLTVHFNTPDMGAVAEIELERQTLDTQKYGGLFAMTAVEGYSERDTMLYQASLPPGLYEVTEFKRSARRADASDLAGLGPRKIVIPPARRGRIGRFVVTEGQSIDLGSVVVTAINSKYLIGRSETPSISLDLLRWYKPEEVAAFASQPIVTGWQPDDGQGDVVTRYAMSHPTGCASVVEAPDGRIVVGCRVGSVLVRSREGRWSILNSARLGTVLHAMAVDWPDTMLVAGGEFGLLLRQPRGGTGLVPMDRGNLPAGHVLFVGGNAAVGAYLALQSGQRVSFFKSKQPEAGSWSLIREEEVTPAYRVGRAQPWIWSTREGFGFATPRGLLIFLDFETGQWTQHKGPGGPWDELVAQPDGAIGLRVAHVSNIRRFGQLFVSGDRGANWQRLPLPKDLQGQGPPVMLPDRTWLMISGSFEAPVLLASSDGGATWAERSKMALNQKLMALPSGLLLAVDRGGFLNTLDIRVSKDGGLTWALELSTFDAEANRREAEAAGASPETGK